MKQWLMLVGVVILAVGWQAAAQEDSGEWRLRVPSATEYVENAGEIIAAAETAYVADFYEDVSYIAEASALMDEIDWRLVNNGAITYDQLRHIYQVYVTREKPQYYLPLTDYRWALELLKLWLDENPTDLSETDELQFDDFVVRVTRLTGSFNGYGGVTWGYWLQLTDPTNVKGSNYIATQADDGTTAFPGLPVSIDGNLLVWGRINDDEYPDIAYLHNTHMGNSYNSGTLIIASLHGDDFETTSGLGYSEGPTFALPPENYAWQFVQLDQKADLEIIQSQRLFDNWGCIFIEVTLFEWDSEGKLSDEDVQTLFPETFNCLTRQAEEAMWNHRYADAIPLYEQAVAIQTDDADLLMYAKTRLGLAYLLSDQLEKARQVFAALDAGDNGFAQAAKIAFEHNPRALPVCQALYEYASHNPDFGDMSGTVDVFDGGFYGPGWYTPGYDLENASCDLPAALEDFLANTSFNTLQSPVEQLEAGGLKVDHSITEDFDQDGKQEWLVWLSSIGIDPLFFYPDGEVYQLSRLRGHSDPAFRGADLRLPDAHNRYSIVTLPDGLGKALVDVDFSIDKYGVMQCNGCGGGPSIKCAERDPNLPDSPGDLTLWRVENGTLTNFFFAHFCKEMTIEQLFPDGAASTRLIAAHTVAAFPDDPYSGDEEVVSATYFWDSAAKTYMLPPEPTPTATSIIAATATPVPRPVERLYLGEISFIQVRKAFLAGDYERVDLITAAAFTQEADKEFRLIFAFRYYRGLALEALGREDEALAEYVAIYEAAPESAWGMLARLHIER